MAGIRYKGQIYSGAASVGNADDVNYDNTSSGLTADNVQDAVDEVVNNVDSLEQRCDNYVKTIRIESQSCTMAAGEHNTVSIPHSYGSSLKYPVVMRTPNAAHVFANIHMWTSSTITVGYYNSAGSAVTGTFSILLFLYDNQ